MNCHTAQRILEIAIPGGSDAGENAQAISHVAECDHCQSVFRERELFDLRAGRACRDVPVPVGARERLLARLAQQETPSADAVITGVVTMGAATIVTALVPESVAEPLALSKVTSREATSREADTIITPLSAARSRRRLLTTIAAVACLLLAVAGFGWHVQRQTLRMIAWTDVEQASVLAIPEEGAPLASFTNGERPRLPHTMDCPRTLVAAVPQILRVGDQAAAVYYFTIRSGRTQREGRLIVMPVHLLRELPPATAFLDGGADYRGHFATTAWVEDGLVFLCCVSGGDEGLRRLLPRNPTT